MSVPEPECQQIYRRGIRTGLRWGIIATWLLGAILKAFFDNHDDICR
jgi:hypothetical protein